MSGLRGPEMASPRQSVRGHKQVKLMNGESEQPHNRSPKMGDRGLRRGNGNVVRSSDSLNQKKLGNRVADLESQLGQAQGELKILKHRLSSAGAAKPVPTKVKNPVVLNHPETDVFEVPVVDLSPPADIITSLNAEIDEKDMEIEKSKRKKNGMKTKIDELNSDITLVRTKETEMSSKMNQLFAELEQSKSVEAELKQRLENLETEKNAMEIQMKKMRIQMEQWRKAAEAAAIMLSDDAQTNCRGVRAEDDEDDNTDDDGFAGGKKKGSGIKIFGEIWKKKG